MLILCAAVETGRGRTSWCVPRLGLGSSAVSAQPLLSSFLLPPPHIFSCYVFKMKGSAWRGSPLALWVLRCSAERHGILFVCSGFHSLSNRSFGLTSWILNLIILTSAVRLRPNIQKCNPECLFEGSYEAFIPCLSGLCLVPPSVRLLTFLMLTAAKAVRELRRAAEWGKCMFTFPFRARSLRTYMRHFRRWRWELCFGGM